MNITINDLELIVNALRMESDIMDSIEHELADDCCTIYNRFVDLLNKFDGSKLPTDTLVRCNAGDVERFVIPALYTARDICDGRGGRTIEPDYYPILELIERISPTLNGGQ